MWNGRQEWAIQAVSQLTERLIDRLIVCLVA